MAIGERIHFFRNLRGMTQKYLGQSIGFDEKSADVRSAQYETGTRTPKDAYTSALAEVLDVSPKALNIPDIESNEGLMHTLFALEDIYGFKINNIDGEICISLKKFDNPSYPMLFNCLNTWWGKAADMRDEKISKDQYDEWRYHYSLADNNGGVHASVTSDKISDAMTKKKAHK